MSLLLQALKKAEEDKRRRAEMMAEHAEESSAAEVEFPALNLVEDDAAEPVLTTEIPPKVEEADANDWDFLPLEVAVVGSETESPVASQADSETQPAIDIEKTDQISHGPEPIPRSVFVQSSGNATDVAPVVELPKVEVVEPAPPQSGPAVASASTPVSPAVPTQDAAKHLFAKSKKSPTRGLLPWLLLGAGLLLAGMVAWFTWQYRQLTQTAPAIDARAPSAPVASSVINAPVYSPEAIASESSQVNTQSNVEAAQITTPPPKLASHAAETIEAKPKPATNTISDSRDLNPPLKFVRQTPHFNAPDPVLMAWQYYQNGDLNQAELLYQKALQADPRQRDALLGLAAIAQQRGDLAAAAAWYQRVLRANPQDESAQAALLMLNSAQLPEQEAVQLEQSGKSDPMVLGQYFAAQQRWSQAQEQFFLAYSANPNSADAALNLAVSLDHLKQTNLAKTYYRKALQSKESIHFDRSKVEQRLAELDVASGVSP